MKKKYIYYVWVECVGHFIEVSESGFHDFIMFLGDREVLKKEEEVSPHFTQVKYFIDGVFLAVVHIEVER